MTTINEAVEIVVKLDLTEKHFEDLIFKMKKKEADTINMLGVRKQIETFCCLKFSPDKDIELVDGLFNKFLEYGILKLKSEQKESK